MTDLSRRNFLKGIAAGAGLALATGIPGISPVEAAVVEAAERKATTGYADFLLRHNGKMTLIGEVTTVNVYRTAPEFVSISPMPLRSIGIRDERAHIDFVSDDHGMSVLQDMFTEGDYVEAQLNFSRIHRDIGEVQIAMPKTLIREFAITLDHGGGVSTRIALEICAPMVMTRA